MLFVEGSPTFGKVLLLFLYLCTAVFGDVVIALKGFGFVVDLVVVERGDVDKVLTLIDLLFVIVGLFW